MVNRRYPQGIADSDFDCVVGVLIALYSVRSERQFCEGVPS